MIQNFIETSDLKKYYPTLDTNLWPETSDFSLQIQLGFERVDADLWAKGVDPRKVMVPIALNTSTGTLVPSMFKRLVITIAASEGEVTLQGSNDNTTFVTVDTISTTTTANKIISDTYKYFKYSATETMSSVKFYETIFDRAIVFAALVYIFGDFMKEVGDVWDIRRQLAEADYQAALTSAKFYYDNNDNQTVDDSDEVKSNSSVEFVR